MRYEGIYTPPSTDVSLSFPGSLGGMNWGSAAVDEASHYLIVNDMRLGLWIRMLPRAVADAPGAADRNPGLLPMTGSPYGVSKDRFMSPLGIPCQKPPYGTVSAIDLRNGKLVWQVPMGTVRDTGPMGLKMGLPIPIGLPTLGGPIATQGGLVFFAGVQDYYLRALSTATGQELWKARLPVGAQATPMTYRSPKTGRQYVVISAGGARTSPDRGDYVIAYALPSA